MYLIIVNEIYRAVLNVFILDLNCNNRGGCLGVLRQDVLLFSHSTPVKPGHALDLLMEKLDLTGLVGSPPIESLPPSGNACTRSHSYTPMKNNVLCICLMPDMNKLQKNICCHVLCEQYQENPVLCKIFASLNESISFKFKHIESSWDEVCILQK